MGTIALVFTFRALDHGTTPLLKIIRNSGLSGKNFAGIGFQLDLAIATDVFKMGFDVRGPFAKASDFDHHFGGAAGYVLGFCL